MPCGFLFCPSRPEEASKKTKLRRCESKDELEKEIHSIIADMSWVENQSRLLEGGSAPPVQAGGAAPPFSFSAPAAKNGDRKAVEADNILPEHENAAKIGSIVRSNTSASMVAEMLSMWGIDQSVPQAHGKVSKLSKKGAF